MSDHIYKKLELTGSSTSSIEEAVNNSLTKASKSIHNLRWFEMVEIRGEIGDKTVSHWHATTKVGFTLDK
jgi:flavin-binding protein dodecin